MAQWPHVTVSSAAACACGTPAPKSVFVAATLPPTAASAPSAPVVFMNVRRLRLGMMSDMTLPLR